MKRISSKWTFFYKRIFPVIFMGFLGFFVLTMISSAIAGERVEEVVFSMFVVLFLLIVLVIVMKLLVWDLVDEVWEGRDFLLVKNKQQEQRIALSEFMNVSYSGYVNPPRITLMLRKPSKFGSEIAFIPLFRMFPFTMPPFAKDLIKRIDAARGEAST